MMENELESDEMMDVTEKEGQKERQVSLFNYIWFNLWQGLRKKREKVEEDPNPMELRPRSSLNQQTNIMADDDHYHHIFRIPSDPVMPSPPWLHHGLPLERLGRSLPHHAPLQIF